MVREKINNPNEAIELGIGYVSDARKREGIIDIMNIKQNLSLPSLPWISTGGFINGKTETGIASKYINDLNIKASSYNQTVNTISGGNQQKISLGKWLARNPKILIMDEPTRGIDVSANRELHKIVESIVKLGTTKGYKRNDGYLVTVDIHKNTRAASARAT